MDHASASFRRARPLLGTFVEISLAHAPTAADEAAVEAAFAAVAKVHGLMSFHEPESDVSRLNREAYQHAVTVDPWTFAVLAAALDLNRRTAGAFDVTVAAVLENLGLLPRSDGSSASTHTSSGDAIELLEGRRVRFRERGVRIDLGGIAKGYSVDRGIAVLQGLGYTRAFVGAGGDSRIIGDRFGKPWIVGIRDPRKGEGNVIARIPLENAAISTSGDYERFFEEGGVRYHHIIDPHTGHSASKVRSATVIGPYATRTDGLSKTAFVLGPDAAMEIYNRMDDIDAIIVKLDGSVVYSKGMQKARP
jgi:thiamine biosynthesis lipoprotein